MARTARSRVRRLSGRWRRPRAAATGTSRWRRDGESAGRGAGSAAGPGGARPAPRAGRRRAGRRPRRAGAAWSSGGSSADRRAAVGRRLGGRGLASAVGCGLGCRLRCLASGRGLGSWVGLGLGLARDPAGSAGFSRRRPDRLGRFGPGHDQPQPDRQLVRIAQLGAVGPVELRPSGGGAELALGDRGQGVAAAYGHGRCPSVAAACRRRESPAASPRCSRSGPPVSTVGLAAAIRRQSRPWP